MGEAMKVNENKNKWLLYNVKQLEPTKWLRGLRYVPPNLMA